MSHGFILLRKSAIGTRTKERGAVLPLPRNSGDIPRIRELMRKYANQPMDLADAAILRVAERLRKIFIVDRRDFSVYRLHNRTRPTLIP